MNQILLFGDSLLQQAFTAPHGLPFGPALTAAYIRRLDVVSRGLSGYNTSQALTLLPQIIPSPSKARLRFLVILFGANDARLPHSQGGRQQHIPLPTFRDNLRQIVTHPCVRAQKDVRIILVAPPLVDERLLVAADEERHDHTVEPNRRTRVSWQYSQAVVELGAELGIPVVDVAGTMLSFCRSASHVSNEDLENVRQGDENRRDGEDYWPGDRDQPVSPLLQSWLRDGLHLTSAGYALLHEELMKVIETEWPDQMPESLAFFYPTWDDETAWKPGTDGEGSRELLKQ